MRQTNDGKNIDKNTGHHEKDRSNNEETTANASGTLAKTLLPEANGEQGLNDTEVTSEVVPEEVIQLEKINISKSLRQLRK